jgi:molybdopterin synthase sulfur carrier subunit
MGVVVHIPGYLRAWTGGAGRVLLDGRPGTVRDALDQLTARHPGVRDRVMDELGEVRPHVNVFVGVESIRFSGGLATALEPGAEITIVPAVSGG